MAYFEEDRTGRYPSQNTLVEMCNFLKLTIMRRFVKMKNLKISVRTRKKFDARKTLKYSNQQKVVKKELKMILPPPNKFLKVRNNGPAPDLQYDLSPS